MKFAALLLVGLGALGGCVASTGNAAHDDNPAGNPSTGGPTLCRDGTPPPCTIRN